VNEITNKGAPDSRYDPGNHVRAKAFDNSLPIGPVVAPPDLVPEDATIELYQNGQQRQCDHRGNLIFPVPELLAEITSYLTLEPGDVVATGSPVGVGPLADGDEIEISVEGIGTLRHSVRIPADPE